MRRDANVVMFGEGVATKRRELVTEFGAERVRNTPLAEGIIAGTAVGAAATGLRPVIDLLFAPFLCYAMEEIVNSAGKRRYISGGQFSFPLVVIAMTGGGWGVGARVQPFYRYAVAAMVRPRTPFFSIVRATSPLALMSSMNSRRYRAPALRPFGVPAAC